MRTLLAALCLSVFAQAQGTKVVPASDGSYTVYQTLDGFSNSTGIEVQASTNGLKRVYSKNAAGVEVLAQTAAVLRKEHGNALNFREIWEPNGITTTLILPTHEMQTTVESRSNRLSGNRKAGGTCAPLDEGNRAVFIGNEILKGLNTAHWSYEDAGMRADKWYWVDADCLAARA